MKSLLAIITLFAVFTASSFAQTNGGKTVTTYLMIETLDELSNAIAAMEKVNWKINFNRLALAFVQPSIHNYTQNNLACTGILGYYCNNRDANVHVKKATQLTDGAADFTTLKAAIAQFKSQGKLEVFLSVGGWNYNCREQIYCETLKWYREDKPKCTPEEHYGYVCEPKGYNQDFDWFPDTKQTDTEKNTWGWAAYANVIKMAKDLGCDGVDLDYEEFWHADWHRRKWDDQKFITDVQKAGSTQAAMQKYFDSLGYGQLVEKYASKQPNRNLTELGPFVLPDTVDKLYRIMNALITNAKDTAPDMKFSIPAAPVGAIPTMVPQYGDANVIEHGGQWWGGNLKGIMYSMVHKYGPDVLKGWDIGLMTYDLGCRFNIDCGGDVPFGCKLVEQVEYYTGTYNKWMRASSSEPIGPQAPSSPLQGKLKADPKMVVPKKFNTDFRLLFGFEIGKPAYPATDDWKKMDLNETDVKAMCDGMKDKVDGVIIWEFFKPSMADRKSQASTAFCCNTACTAFGLGSDGFDCSADFPHNDPKMETSPIFEETEVEVLEGLLEQKE